MPNPFDYEAIEPLLTSSEIRGSWIFARFTCPMTGRTVSASAEIRPLPPERDPRFTSEKGILGGLRHSLGAALSGMLGTVEHAEAAVATAPQASDSPPMDADEEARRRTIVRAFRSVSSLFRWDRENERWTSADAGIEMLTRFESQLAVHPVRNTPDIMTLLRMVVHLSRADGNFGEEERAFLEPFARAARLDVDELAEGADPDKEELQRTDPSRRESILMICWAVALCDTELVNAEMQLLERYRQELGVRPERATELKNRAQYYLLEKTLEEVFSAFQMTYDEEDRVITLGGKLGLPLADIQNAIDSFKRRRGLS